MGRYVVVATPLQGEGGGKGNVVGVWGACRVHGEDERWWFCGVGRQLPGIVVGWVGIRGGCGLVERRRCGATTFCASWIEVWSLARMCQAPSFGAMPAAPCLGVRKPGVLQ
jgi:hypothetical protein